MRLVAALAASAAPACQGCDPEEEEEAETERDNLWRVQVAIQGAGAVTTAVVGVGIACRSDGTHQSGACGPVFLRFKERVPPLLRAEPAPGWRLDRWESVLRAHDGTARPRSGPMPDGVLYLNGMGYTDNGVLETVTPVFVRGRDAG